MKTIRFFAILSILTFNSSLYAQKPKVDTTRVLALSLCNEIKNKQIYYLDEIGFEKLINSSKANKNATVKYDNKSTLIPYMNEYCLNLIKDLDFHQDYYYEKFKPFRNEMNKNTINPNNIELIKHLNEKICSCLTGYSDNSDLEVGYFNCYKKSVENLENKFLKQFNKIKDKQKFFEEMVEYSMNNCQSFIDYMTNQDDSYRVFKRKMKIQNTEKKIVTFKKTNDTEIPSIKVKISNKTENFFMSDDYEEEMFNIINQLQKDDLIEIEYVTYFIKNMKNEKTVRKITKITKVNN